MEVLYRILTNRGVYGIITDKDGYVIDSAPMGKWSKGRHIDSVNRRVKQLNGTIELIKVYNNEK
jgi:UDP-N-acetyl-D-mannosaminuronic acid transferase (WecB/TagA/CpsF family)